MPMRLGSFFKALRGGPPAAAFPPPGLYHFDRQGNGQRSRVHLRIDSDESGRGSHGILLVNASRVLHLNATATAMAYLALRRASEAEAIAALTGRFRVSGRQAKADYARFLADLEELLHPEGACPVCDLEVDVILPFSHRPSAPYRMDLALTYRCNDDCAHCYNARPRDFREIGTGEWKRILDRLWEIGVPHVVFTGGEPTLREDLCELIAHAERNSQIAGLNTNGRRLSDARYVQKLVDAGLDHVQITVESHQEGIHDGMVGVRGAWKQTIAGLRNALDTPLFVMTNTTMLRANSPYLSETLDFLAGLGVPTVGLNALIYSGRALASAAASLAEGELPSLLELARQRKEAHGQRLIWYTPTQYCQFDPMQLELGVKGCTAALYNMCVEPDGAVIPCQSYYRPVGNLLVEAWETIWNHPLCLYLRERRYVPQKCAGCALLEECGGGCPLALDAQRQGLIPLDSVS